MSRGFNTDYAGSARRWSATAGIGDAADAEGIAEVLGSAAAELAEAELRWCQVMCKVASVAMMLWKPVEGLQ